MANKLRGLTNDNYAKWSLQGVFTPHGEEGGINLGDIEALGYTPNLTEIERYTKETPEKTLARTDVIQKDATLNLTLKSITSLVRAALFMDDPEQYLTQSATTKTVTFAKLVKGRVYATGLKDITVTSFEGDAVTFVEGTHFRVISETGHIEWIGDTVATGGELDVSGAAITVTSGKQQFGLMAGNGLRGKLDLFGSNEIGVPMHIEFWDVKLTPSGEVALQGGDDYTEVQLTGRVYADLSRDARFRFGCVTELSA
ncbi:phage tail tube protein [Gellertiella hungarica]|uniref:Uncharacterized protein n=1 Tax=Gellertiella hungarica TaxID=1572859 RepID=A0A7W6J4S5_9HYPH|nr:hypothetical protein [Gellertiella hungarica]MBB4064052.1 hypothetical protein [Gellertiella hungarica]